MVSYVQRSAITATSALLYCFTSGVIAVGFRCVSCVTDCCSFVMTTASLWQRRRRHDNERRRHDNSDSASTQDRKAFVTTVILLTTLTFFFLPHTIYFFISLNTDTSHESMSPVTSFRDFPVTSFMDIPRDVIPGHAVHDPAAVPQNDLRSSRLRCSYVSPDTCRCSDHIESRLL